MIGKLWNALWSPSRLATATLLIGGGFLGLAVFGGFSIFLHHSNSLEFCTSCHEMDTPYAEYSKSKHASNRTGAHAVCADCHVPKALGPMLVRKVMATNHVVQMVLGKIDTPEKYEAHRLEMARKVWGYMEKRKSRECHNCHSYANMTRTLQNEKAQRRHAQADKEGEACVSCHKGLAHKLPDFDAAVADAREVLEGKVGQGTGAARGVVPVQTVKLHGEAQGSVIGSVLAAAPLDVLERQDGWFKVRLTGWSKDGKASILFDAPWRPVFRAGLKQSGLEYVAPAALAEGVAPGWNRVQLEGWIEDSRLVSSVAPVWTFAEAVYDLKCGTCHRAYPATQYTAEEWAEHMKAMKSYAKLDKEDHRLVQIYLQFHARNGKQAAAEAAQDGKGS